VPERGGSAGAPRWQRTIGGTWERLDGAPDVEDTDAWQTPAELVDLLERSFAPDGFFDPAGCEGCPMTERARESVCWPEADVFARESPWPQLPTICNPPWSATGKWVRELLRCARGGIALIAPLRLDTVWAREFAPTVVLVPPSRLKYLDPATGAPVGSPRTSSGVWLRGVGRFSARARVSRGVFERAGWREWRPMR
jgi:hypothetical protein